MKKRKASAGGAIKKRDPRKDWQLYLLLLVPVIYIIIFKYIPMGGLVIAFKEYKVRKGIWGSDWVGFENFIEFFQSYQFWRVLKNTVILSVYTIIVSFPFPIIFALMINSVRNEKFKKVTQTIVNMPHFISTVVMVGIVFAVFNNRTGIYGNLVHAITGSWPQDLFASPSNFRHFYVWSAVWQNFGWDSIIYTAALSSVDPSYHEAAQIDGASRFKRVIHVDLPTILPTIITMLILRMGSVMTIGFEKVYLMQNSLNLSASEIISTYVYQVGLSAQGSGDFSYATAIGMFNNVIEFVLVVTVNKISKKVSETSLW
ncbi:MAG: sugar ABC transporter permease [Lachnospiraceae bacterium]|nr:sugar ABC transporter permease [Lachnospiraceae bacterium]